MDTVTKISKIQTSVIQMLGVFRFLTLSQLLALEVGTTQYKYLWKQVNELLQRRRKLVDRVHFNTIDRVSRVEDIYFLTKFGKQILIDLGISEDVILMPKGSPLSAKDYRHKLTTIDFQISIYKWTQKDNLELIRYSRYFDKLGNNRIGKNLSSLSKLKRSNGTSIIPDSLFVLRKQDFERLFLFELHFGKDSARIELQITKHIELLLSGEAHQQLDYPANRAYYILVLFEFQSTLDALIERLKEQFNRFINISPLVLCKSIESLQTSTVDQDWLSILGEKYSLNIN